MSALRDFKLNVTIQGMQACTDPIWPFTLEKMLGNIHSVK